MLAIHKNRISRSGWKAICVCEPGSQNQRVSYDARKDIEGLERTALYAVQGVISSGTSLVAMVQAAHLRYRHDRTDFWPLARAWLGRVFAQRQVRSGSMIVIEIAGKSSA